MRLRPSHVPFSLTGEEREARPGQASLWRGVPARPAHGMAAMRRNPGNHIDTKILTALVFFVLKFAWFLIKD